jgi:hypothetical protein
MKEILPWAFAGCNLVLSILVILFGTGRATRSFDEKLELVLKRFQVGLDERLDRRFAELQDQQREMEEKMSERLSGYVRNEMLDLRIKLIDGVLEQHNHRLSRTQEQTTMVIDAMFKAGVYVVSGQRPKKEQEPQA